MNIDENIEKCNFNSDVLKYVDEIKKNYFMDAKQTEENAFKLINEELSWIVEKVPYYKRLYEEGKFPAHINSFEEFRKIPFVEKQHLRDNYPFGFLGTSLADVIRYGESTGTSGLPTAAYMTREDWDSNIARVSMYMANFFSKEDIIFVMIPYELAFSSFDMDKTFWNIGSTVVAIGAKNQVCPMERVADMMLKVRPTTLICSPTRAIRLYHLLKSRGCNMDDMPLKKIIYVGETCSDVKLEKIKKLWNVEMFSVYGSTETNSIALPCENNVSHLEEDRFYFELINPETGEILPDGEEGELVITTLLHKALPLIRYRTGDYVKFIKEPCSCGLHFRAIKHMGRCNDNVSINGRKIKKNVLEQCVLLVEGTGCNYVSFVKEDKLHIAIDVEDNFDQESVLQAVKDAIMNEFGVSAEVHILDLDEYFKVVDALLKPGSIDWNKIF